MKTILVLSMCLLGVLNRSIGAEVTNHFVVNCNAAYLIPPKTSSLFAYSECLLVDKTLHFYGKACFECCESYIKGPAAIDENGAVIFSLLPGFWGIENGWNFAYTLPLADAQISELMKGLWYVEIFIPGGPDGTDCSPALRGQILLDSDNDGVADLYDSCTNTPAGTIVNTNGCSIDQLCPCDGSWKNHGEYVKAVDRVSKQFLNEGLITAQQRKAILLAATKSNCGKPTDSDRDSVPNRIDRCPNTCYRDSVDCRGCSIDQLCPCNGPWQNHGHYVRAVMVETMRFYAERRLNRAQAISIVSKAHQSKCGYSWQPRARVSIPVH